ncbi:valine--tRNA ligase-like [Acanthaster planci]|uniref:Valine--tRNA ligase, mitochondrial n=1 Tax=Acanthaster planci TaxID=133434 RepID=A0A8B7XYG2_ACAPL|nr:valine--tRNA ligase-like [Acanthaster planci]
MFRSCIAPKSLGINCRFVHEKGIYLRNESIGRHVRRWCRANIGSHGCAPTTAACVSTSSQTGSNYADGRDGKDSKSDRMQGKLEKMRRRQQRQDQLESSHLQKSGKVRAKQSKAWRPKEVVTYDIPTMPGEKKDTSVPLPDSYSPAYVESAWYAWWERMGFFKPEYAAGKNADAKPYVTCLPPPNVTGMLHLGHTLMVAIEDSLVRWHRMRGRPTLWIPGSDHAGIATQIMVEKSLWQHQRKTRHDLGRAKFTEEVWKWKKEKGDEIYRQLKQLGASLDWDRSKFTMDEDYAHSVREAFIHLHDNGTIYRSTQLVNWSCSLKSVISDIEVESKSIDGRKTVTVPGYAEPVEFGTLTLFSYPVHNSDESITVATTRLETMLGDTALAVHPDDMRYIHLIGQTVDHPFMGKSLPIIADPSVDREFGTGVVKITPAHDFRDYDLGQRHNLPSVTVINDTGCMTEDCRQFKGMKRFEARKAVAEALKEKGLFVGARDHPMDIPLCRRSKDIVEPMLKTQWFVDSRWMAQEAVASVESGQLKIVPEVHKKVWYNWLKNIRDWCISRQLWWGHRIPVYHITSSDDTYNKHLDNCWVSAHTEKEAVSKAAEKFQVPVEKIKAEQDPDVLDTWFSSALFPFAILGWPEKTSDLQRYFPTTMLETGHDILFFWVARMVMMSSELMGRLPFTEVYLHSMVRDAHGRKMSKSLGNVIDPLDVIHGSSLEDLHKKLMSGVKLDEPELSIALRGQRSDFPNGIPECGTDALRFALCTYKAQVEDLNLNIDTVLEYRHFCNKIWNAVRFTLNRLGQDFTPLTLHEISSELLPMDRWILSRLSAAAEACNWALEQYEFPTATTAIHQFWIQAFCDVYLESVKGTLASADQQSVRAAQNTLYHCVHAGLRLLSPFMPYLTEELYQRLPKVKGDDCPSVCVAKYPISNHFPTRDTKLEQEVELVMDTVRTMRSVQKEFGIKMPEASAQIVSDDMSIQKTLERFSDTMATLSRCSCVTVTSVAPPPSGWVYGLVNDSSTVYVSVKDSIDSEDLIKKLTARRKKLLTQLDNHVSSTKSDIEKIPLRVQEANRQKTLRLQSQLEKLESTLKQLEDAS